MIWEVDDDADGCIDWDEFRSLFYRIRDDQSGAAGARGAWGGGRSNVIRVSGAPAPGSWGWVGGRGKACGAVTPFQQLSQEDGVQRMPSQAHAWRISAMLQRDSYQSHNSPLVGRHNMPDAFKWVPGA